MDVTPRYRESWEGYWRETSDAPGEAIWDADPVFSAAPHSELLLPHADASLPVVDLGCGSGTQTRYLATRFAGAIGVDLSRAAVDHARRADPAGVARYEQLDLVDQAAVRALSERIGDVNVYMRAVIHQSEPQDRPAVAGAVATLLGARGRAFVTELTSGSKDVLRRAAEGPGGPPEKLRRVFAHGLRPADAEDDEMPELLGAAGLTVLASGQAPLPQTEYLADGTRIELPASWYVLAKR
ncbi:class I SAM-dependent methyltransferase [Streptomyces corynorhini]|uniref:Class I SAM-dependent methyltransferase n=1 Tax=Streptomyces corynorhini TaxID=2282652 RepID=A0A370BG99_9ACTN|nr:class I SAM-dependent methyltransferase [Streptomyces corynorhini]RDG39389.1 class I SAM-dependent methyltransferase [Streptomyces corynorhini]